MSSSKQLIYLVSVAMLYYTVATAAPTDQNRYGAVAAGITGHRAGVGVATRGDQESADNSAVQSCNSNGSVTCQIVARFSGGACDYATSGVHGTQGFWVMNVTSEKTYSDCLARLGGGRGHCNKPVGTCTSKD